jgi:transposase InsO family protein
VNGSKQPIQARRLWIKLYEKTQDAGLVCRRCGVSRPTLRKWWRRFQQHGDEGLSSKSRAPLHSPNRKVDRQQETLIMDLRRTRKLGPQRIQAELLRLHNCRLSTATIWKVLHRHNVKPLVRRQRTRPKRFTRKVPGECVQLDTRKIAPGVYQYTAVDDCTRLRVLGIYPRRTAKNSVHFLEERLLHEFPFPIQRVQTDRGAEFFGTPFQNALRRHCIKFRPNRPRAPHLNGKVERSQQTDEMEFWVTVDLSSATLALQLEEWQFFYNWQRPHSALRGLTPMSRYCELIQITPFRDEAHAAFDSTTEHHQERDYKTELQVRAARSLRCGGRQRSALRSDELRELQDSSLRP